MGQKVNPIGLRIGVNKSWESVWFDEKNYANKLHEDIIIRNYDVAGNNSETTNTKTVTITSSLTGYPLINGSTNKSNKMKKMIKQKEFPKLLKT